MKHSDVCRQTWLLIVCGRGPWPTSLSYVNSEVNNLVILQF